MLTILLTNTFRKKNERKKKNAQNIRYFLSFFSSHQFTIIQSYERRESNCFDTNGFFDTEIFYSILFACYAISKSTHTNRFRILYFNKSARRRIQNNAHTARVLYVDDVADVDVLYREIHLSTMAIIHSLQLCKIVTSFYRYNNQNDLQKSVTSFWFAWIF